MCTECVNEYRLIGVLFGLAVYNNILVDVHFPLVCLCVCVFYLYIYLQVLYRKLLSAPVTFRDLADYDPVCWWIDFYMF
jgi:hypothetical protein